MVCWSVSRQDNLIGNRNVWFLIVMAHENYLKVNFSTITNNFQWNCSGFGNLEIILLIIDFYVFNILDLEVYTLLTAISRVHLFIKISNQSPDGIIKVLSVTPVVAPQVVVKGGNRLLEVQPHWECNSFIFFQISTQTQCAFNKIYNKTQMNIWNAV